MSNVSGLIVAEGDESRVLNEKKRSSTKVRFAKAGQSFRGRLLTTKFVSYYQHGSFEEKIVSHACIDPKGKTGCPSCKAGVLRKLKTILPMWDIDAKEIVVRDMAKSNMVDLYKLVDQLGDDLLTDTYAISLGEKGALTVVYLKPKKGETFDATPEGTKLDEETLSYVMGVRTADEISALIAGKTGTPDSGVAIKPVDGLAPAPGPIINGQESF